MTVQEAIKNLQYLITDDCTDTQFDYIEEIKLAISALEKQESLKSIQNEPCYVKAFDGDSKVVTYKCLPCPSCNKWIVCNPTHKYCEYCGQALELGQ